MINLSNMKVAIYGGSFNPIHIGHLLTGFDVIEKLGYDYVIFVPDNIPPHKDYNNLVNPIDRLNMVKNSVKNIKKFLFSDIEIKRGGISYTIDTVRELKDLFNVKNKFGVIFGDDLLDDIEYWKEIDILNNISDLICLYRNNDRKIETRYNINWVKNRKIEISSTEIRNRIRNGLSIDFMVDLYVKNYIIKKKLYRK